MNNGVNEETLMLRIVSRVKHENVKSRLGKTGIFKRSVNFLPIFDTPKVCPLLVSEVLYLCCGKLHAKMNLDTALDQQPFRN